MAFWKRQNYGAGKKINKINAKRKSLVAWNWGRGGMKKHYTEDF